MFPLAQSDNCRYSNALLNDWIELKCVTQGSGGTFGCWDEAKWRASWSYFISSLYVGPLVHLVVIGGNGVCHYLE